MIYHQVNRTIPDGTQMGLFELRHVASEIKTLSAVRVRLHIAGQFNGDLYAYVRHVNLQATNFCILLNRSGRSAVNAAGYSDAGLSVMFDNAAAADIHLYGTVTNLPPGAPLAGTWQPDGRNVDPLGALDTSNRTTTLNSFAGADASGEWTLFVADADAGATNILLGWELELVGAIAPPLSWPDPTPIVYGTALGPAQLNATAGSVSGTFVYAPPAGTILSPGTNHTLSVEFTPADTASYVPTTNTVALAVSRAPLTVTAANASRLYGDPNPAFTGTVAGLQNGESVAASYSCAATPASPIGNYTIVPSLSGSARSNYTVALTSGTLVISPAVLAVTTDSASRVYGTPNPVFTGSIVGIKNSEPLSVTYTCAANPGSSVGAYDIVPMPAGTTLSNYAVNTTTGKLTITKAAASLAVSSSKNPQAAGQPVTFFRHTQPGRPNHWDPDWIGAVQGRWGFSRCSGPSDFRFGQLHCRQLNGGDSHRHR